MSDEKDYVERDEIHKNYDITLTGFDEESEEIDKINRKEQDGLESEKSETYERDHIEISDLMNRIDSPKKGDDNDPVDTGIIEKQKMKNQREISDRIKLRR